MSKDLNTRNILRDINPQQGTETIINKIYNRQIQFLILRDINPQQGTET